MIGVFPFFTRFYWPDKIVWLGHYCPMTFLMTGQKCLVKIYCLWVSILQLQWSTPARAAEFLHTRVSWASSSNVEPVSPISPNLWRWFPVSDLTRLRSCVQEKVLKEPNSLTDLFTVSGGQGSIQTGAVPTTVSLCRPPNKNRPRPVTGTRAAN